MCLKVRTRLPIQKSVVCYKVLLKSDTRYTSPYGYNPMRWYRGRTETADPKEYKACDGTKEIKEGYFHAYTTYGKAVRESRRLLVNLWGSKMEEYVVCKMLIPTIAGEVFYGANQDICAKRMRFVKEMPSPCEKKKKKKLKNFREIQTANCEASK